jgi:hypothetical protein
MTDHDRMTDDWCNACEMDFFDLINKFVKDIQHLESKAVHLRYLLSKYLPEYDGEMLRCDIFNDLSDSYWDHPAYQKYMSVYCDGRDPIDSKPYTDLLWKLSRGKETVGL